MFPAVKIVTKTVKTTTPTPSLKRLSPEIIAFKVGEILTVLKIPNTATGSVGDIKEPKIRHQTNGTEKSNKAETK
tara:strand:+ start:1100 stop:1324 length:225 start_codon:yes stop_codon:yes gene_type:complete